PSPRCTTLPKLWNSSFARHSRRFPKSASTPSPKTGDDCTPPHARCIGYRWLAGFGGQRHHTPCLHGVAVGDIRRAFRRGGSYGLGLVADAGGMTAGLAPVAGRVAGAAGAAGAPAAPASAT